VSYQFDDFDEDPIVGRCSEDFEESGSKSDVIFRIFTSEFANHIY
jgi:hypothetical protein